MSIPFTGGCMCGAVRYECATEPLMAANCHCLDCQRATGSAYASVFFVPKSAVKITGEVKYYESKGDSGSSIRRGFCPTCGSRLFGLPAVMSENMGIMAGSLDDSSSHKPAIDIYTSSAQPWDYMNPEVAKFPKGPPMG
ncbi:MAG: GFA family protein [Deltaproteobacteria bacterium]|nr:GFA family protein [Deltaproteobacteria bacterium]